MASRAIQHAHQRLSTLAEVQVTVAPMADEQAAKKQKTEPYKHTREVSD